MSEYHYSDCDCNGWESMCPDCQDQLTAMEQRVKDCEQFVKAWDERKDAKGGLAVFCTETRLLELREKIGVIE